MAIIRPRLIDFYNIPITQEEVDFAIPFLDEDIPLYLDPFLLWKSPSQQGNALHLILINSFNKLGATYLKNEDKRELIAENLAGLSECSEVGLGSGKTKKGLKISINTAKEILDLFSIVPQYKTGGFSHFEEIQLYVNNISKDFRGRRNMKDAITQEAVTQYELLCPLLSGIYGELQELSKKKPDTPLNNFKVKSINRVLEPIKELLKEENMYPFLDVLAMDDMPTNSDVVLILSQYIKSMDIFHDKYYGYNSRSGQYEWSTK